MKDRPSDYKVVYDKDWEEWRVTNDHDMLRPTEDWDAEYMYGFPTLGEALMCRAILKGWHNNSIHPSFRKAKEWFEERRKKKVSDEQ